MSYEMVVGDDSEDCSKVTVPLTVESPRRTATRVIDDQLSSYTTKDWVAKGAIPSPRYDGTGRIAFG